jgi:hypothetical protein
MSLDVVIGVHERGWFARARFITLPVPELGAVSCSPEIVQEVPGCAVDSERRDRAVVERPGGPDPALDGDVGDEVECGSAAVEEHWQEVWVEESVLDGEVELLDQESLPGWSGDWCRCWEPVWAEGPVGVVCWM